MRAPVQDVRRPAVEKSAPVDFPAPTRGWNTNANLAAMPQGFAVKMDNFIARPEKVELRKGQANHVTGFGGSEVVESLLVFQPTGSGAKMFAASDTGVYDATTAGTVGAAAFACTDGAWQSANFANSSGNYLIAVNGADNLRYYDGSTWTAVATYGTINTNTLIGVAVYQQRLFFIEENARRVLYLPAGAITGTASPTALNVEQLFPRGGYVQAIGTWTMDSGSGMDDRFVAVTSEGEVAVFVGTDPSSTATWQLIGVYLIGRPLGRRCLHKLGGDLLVNTERGIFPLSKAVQSSTIEPTTALTFNIESKITEKARSLFSTFGWEMCISTSEQILIVNVPDSSKVQYVMQLQTGGWSQFTNHNASCFAYFNGDLYYGTTGKVVKAMTGTSDFGANIEAEVIYAYSKLGASGRKKFPKMLLPMIETDGPTTFSLGISTDFSTSFEYRTVSVSGSTGGVWGTDTWDNFVWGGDNAILKQWTTVPARDGAYIAPAFKISTSTVQPSLLSILGIFQQGTMLV